MAEFVEQWWSFEVSLSAACKNVEADPDAPSTIYHGAVHDAGLHDISIFEEAPDVEGSVTAIEDVSNIFEFFDLENAALNMDGLPPPHNEPFVPSTSISATLCSPAPDIVTFNSVQDYIHPVQSVSDLPIVYFQSDERTLNIRTETYQAAPLAPANPILQPSTGKKRSRSEDLNRGSCVERGDVPNATKKRKKPTLEQLDNSKKVRAHRACLRCFVQKCKCSGNRPCDSCPSQCTKGRSTGTFQWTSCISSNLQEFNIFALGISLSTDLGVNANGTNVQQPLDTTTAPCLYRLLVKQGFFQGTLPELYIKVLTHAYGHQATKVHPFITLEPIPLYKLIQINVVLMGSPVLGAELVGSVRYWQTLRAICAMVTFTCLERALDQTVRSPPNSTRQYALIVQLALLLDQVIELQGDISAAAIACARGTVFEEMRQHLIQYLSYYLKKLTSHMFVGPNPLLRCIEGAKRRGHVGQRFWYILSALMPSIPLQKPPVIREYADMLWSHHGEGDGEALHEFFSQQCSISCR